MFTTQEAISTKFYKDRKDNMGFLAGKKILIAGLLSDRSIAYGIAEAMKREGAELALLTKLKNTKIALQNSRQILAQHWYFTVMWPKIA
jgi:enoyl-[acyl-carrier-protein] reductase (NADH)